MIHQKTYLIKDGKLSTYFTGIECEHNISKSWIIMSNPKEQVVVHALSLR